MAYIGGVGFRVVKLVDGAGQKNFIKIKQVDDLSVKNYVNVAESASEDNKDYVNAYLVDYDYPKDYIRVNFVAPYECNIYLYGVDNTSSLQLGESFTGDFKGWIAGTSSAGVNPDLLSIIDGTWQDTVDLGNPVWNKFSGNVTALEYIVASGFIGYVTSYAKDGVWVDVDMGSPIQDLTLWFVNDNDNLLIDGLQVVSDEDTE